MRAFGVSGEQPQRLHEDSNCAASVRGERGQYCSDFESLRSTWNVVFVGAERRDEFTDGMRLASQGHNVTVVNPRESPAAGAFRREGGNFIRTTIERLPLTLGPFDLICENYPFTITRVRGICEDDPCPVWLSGRAMRAYAMARLRRLAPSGRWVVFTESPGFACALRSLARRDLSIRRIFSVRVVSLSSNEAPRSSYPHLTTRFQIILQRRPAELETNVPARVTSL
jgi:hypothetical protein